jgi:hypothetical protein
MPMQAARRVERAPVEEEHFTVLPGSPNAWRRGLPSPSGLHGR